MDTFNINILPEENSVNITQGEPVNISVSQEVVQIAKIDESINLEFLGDVTKIDANYPEALAAAQTAIEKAAEIEQTVEQGTADFNANAAEKTTEFNQNAANQTTAFNANAVNKTADFNANAVSQTTLFNENAAEKQADVDASAALAKQYAIGDPTEPTGNSAKYWAGQAQAELSGLTSRVSNIEGKIPSAASSSNQLADKSYVDSADNGLQQQIDAITAASDVTDIVGTYAQLQAYDTTSLPDNSIIKVLQDESRNNETTYYRWVITGGVGAWVLIGEEGPYYTIAAANAVFATISALNGKQDTLVSGTNIKTINNNSILGSGDLTLDGLPSQTGHSGEFLTTDGTNASWADVSTRNIGEIVQSTIPLTDAGLHLLDGALLQGSGAYGDFVTYIAGLVSDYPDLFDTEANWQQSVTDYGVCGKFVYDSVNGMVRLPKIIGFTESTIDATVLGDLVEAGLPNITGSITEMMSRNQTITATGALSTGTVTAFKPSGGNYNLGHADVNIDASASSSIYGNSSTVQPQAIKVLYYIVVANSTKTQIEVDIDEVMTDLNGKADVDLSNVNSTGTALASGWAMPSDTYDDLTLGASGATYTAPANGYFVFCKVAGASNKYINIHNTTTQMAQQAFSTGSDNWLRINCPVKAGDIIQIDYNVTGATKYFRFIYAQGEV